MPELDEVKARFYQQWEATRELGPARAAIQFEMVNQNEIDRLDLFCYFLFGRSITSPDVDSAWTNVEPEVAQCLERMRQNGVPEIAEAANFYHKVVDMK